MISIYIYEWVLLMRGGVGGVVFARRGASYVYIGVRGGATSAEQRCRIMDVVWSCWSTKTSRRCWPILLAHHMRISCFLRIVFATCRHHMTHPCTHL